ncbi:hypothetical protein FRC07_005863, partial [Ceratobasidium sp. 392]
MYTTDNPYWWCDDVDTRAGCLVGGGAAINGINYWYPTDVEFAESNGWPAGWNDILPYLDKVKSRLPSTDAPSTDGKRYLTQSFDVMKSVLDNQSYKQITINDDRNSKDHVYGYPNYYIQGGKRTGPMDTYLKSAKTRSNFELKIYTKVLSIVRNGAQITGVRTNDTSLGPNGIIDLGNDKGRVILAAGAFGTVKLLFQSGIGPSDMLSIAAADPTVSKYMPPASQYIDLPVGMNVKDNPAVPLAFAHPSVDDYDGWSLLWSGPRPADVSQYLSEQAGVLAAPSSRLSFWRAYVGPDGKTRYTQGT